MQVKSTKLAKVLFVLIEFIILLQDLVSREKSAGKTAQHAPPHRRGSEAATGCCGRIQYGIILALYVFLRRR
jgi:hypothetical protein